jgi:hypothetical protein
MHHFESLRVQSFRFIHLTKRGRGAAQMFLHCDCPHIVGWSVLVWGFVVWNMVQVLYPVVRCALVCGMLCMECGATLCPCRRRRVRAQQHFGDDGDGDGDGDGPDDSRRPVGKCIICFQDPPVDPVWCAHCSAQRDEGRACCRRCLWAWTRTGSPTCPLCRCYTH